MVLLNSSKNVIMLSVMGNTKVNETRYLFTNCSWYKKGDDGNIIAAGVARLPFAGPVLSILSALLVFHL